MIYNVNVMLFISDSPVYMSHPHFYNADPALLSTVYGLSPNEDDHGLFIDIHPVRKPKHSKKHPVRTLMSVNVTKYRR